jgi:MFS family permease
VRGIPLAVAGLASATAAGCALLATLVAGSAADRRGPKATMVAGLGCSTLAYALYPYVSRGWQALAVAALAGTGIGTWLTMQSSLVAMLTPPELRHMAFAWQRVAANVGLGLGGFAGGMIVTTGRPATFTALFWLNAATFVVYAGFLARIPAASAPPAARRDYRDVFADRVFLRFAALNLAFVAAAVSLLNALLPVFAKNQAHVSERVIGALFLLNSLAVIALQVRVARAVEGRRRMAALAAMGLLWAAAWLLVATAPAAGGASAAAAVLTAAILVFSLAECVHDAVQGPLVSDLAPPELLPRYLAVAGFSWQLGFIAGPAVGALILAARPTALWLVAAVICAAGGGYALRLDRSLPDRVRRTAAV